VATVATRADALRLTLAGTEVTYLKAVGTVSGVKIDQVAGRCGPGTACLRSRGSGGQQLSFKAPGSAQWGMDVNAAGGGSYLLEDGEDVGKWLRVTVYVDYLREGDESRVLLQDGYNNGIGHDDVTYSEAESGDVADYTVTVKNESDRTVSKIKVWLDAAVSGLEISDDDVT